MSEERRIADNLIRFWQDEDIKQLLLDIREDVVKEWETAKTKETREDRHAELRMLTRLVQKFKAKCEHADVADTRKLRT